MSSMSKAAKEAVFEASIKPIEHSMKFKVATMTPEWATELLKCNHPNNRHMKPCRIETFERDMRGGHWKLTHQGIAVDEDGFLVDGQNRLQAVVNCLECVPMLIVTGVPRKAMVAADYTATRSVADSARIFGKAFESHESSWGSVARQMMVGMESRKGGRSAVISHQEIIAFSQRHKDAIEFAFEATGANKRGLCSAQVRAVIARAWYKRNSRSRIRLFCDYLMSGLVDNIKTDAAVIKLRNWLMDVQARKQGGGSIRAQVYAKTEEAMLLFLASEPCDRLGQVKVESFPLESDAEDSND